MSATSRYRLDPAPGGLLLVQDLLNTCGVHAYAVRDLLGTVTDAQRWVRTVVPAWREATGATGSPGRLSGADLPGLRALRLDVAHSVSGRPVTTAAQVDLLPGPAGVRVQPIGTGVAWLSGAVWGQVLLAQADGGWARLKTCRGAGCPCAFYDVSRNNSRVWHDVHTCGNVANLRASRARRRASR